VTTVYIAGLYEYQAGATTHYYEGNAFRRTGYAANNGLFYLLQDHLGSSRDHINQDGTRNGRNFYFPYGGNRAGVPYNPRSTRRFTGEQASLASVHWRPFPECRALAHRSI
jgi:hypothetical protein